MKAKAKRAVARRKPVTKSVRVGGGRNPRVSGDLPTGSFPSVEALAEEPGAYTAIFAALQRIMKQRTAAWRRTHKRALEQTVAETSRPLRWNVLYDGVAYNVIELKGDKIVVRDTSPEGGSTGREQKPRSYPIGPEITLATVTAALRKAY
jgi:hypothetical protein